MATSNERIRAPRGQGCWAGHHVPQQCRSSRCVLYTLTWDCTSGVMVITHRHDHTWATVVKSGGLVGWLVGRSVGTWFAALRTPLPSDRRGRACCAAHSQGALGVASDTMRSCKGRKREDMQWAAWCAGPAPATGAAKGRSVAAGIHVRRCWHTQLVDAAYALCTPSPSERSVPAVPVTFPLTVVPRCSTSAPEATSRSAPVARVST